MARLSSGRLLSALVALAIGLAPVSAAAETVTLWHAYRGAEREALEQVIRRINDEQDDLVIEPLVRAQRQLRQQAHQRHPARSRPRPLHLRPRADRRLGRGPAC